jgi:hypothetical protein
MGFTGFDPATVALLAELPDWDADQYSTRKAELAAGVTKPGRALIEDVAGRLDADLTVTSRSSVSPLHRDLRFAPEGSPRYKDHLLLTAWQGAGKRTSPTVWIRIDSERAGFASGIGFTPEIRDRWRSTIGSDDGAALTATLDQLTGDPRPRPRGPPGPPPLRRRTPQSRPPPQDRIPDPVHRGPPRNDLRSVLRRLVC